MITTSAVAASSGVTSRTHTVTTARAQGFNMRASALRHRVGQRPSNVGLIRW
jgi:hypothetical protein